jgi:cell division protein FtsW (lipid II flippase)
LKTDWRQLDLDAQLSINIGLITGFTPNPGDSFQIMSFGSRSGTFATINAPGFVVNVNATNVIVTAP